MNLKQLFANCALVGVSSVIGLIVCEAGGRFVVNPADYLSTTLRPDPVLGIAVAPGSGFDKWGFRNPDVPAAADIVTVGDSHTFGNTASMKDAWPSVLARESGRSVYNLGLGGYGPNQYYHLLTSRGLSLHPKHVICGLYMGDDFENAFSITYGLEHWASLRHDQHLSANADIWGDDEPPGLFKGLRNWLSRSSLVYRVVVHGPVLAGIKERLQFSQVGTSTDPFVTTLEDPEHDIKEAFRPAAVASRLDQSRPEIREGMRITFHLLAEMNRACREQGCSFSVVIIPTKETVFADYLQRDPQLHLREAVDAVIANERVARQELGKFLEDAGIPYVDSLPALRQAVGRQLYYRGPADMHPGKNGYEVIGNVAAQFLSAAASRRE